MAQVAGNAMLASPKVTGGVSTAPKGTALPTSTTATPDAAFVSLGYVADDGLQATGDAASTDDFFAWGGDQIATTVTQKATRKFTFSLLEVFSPDVNELIFGSGNVTVTAAGGGSGTRIAIEDTGEDVAAAIYLFDMQYGGKAARFVVPDGHLVLSAERDLVHTDLYGYTCEVTCLPDDDGVRIYRYLANDDVA